MITRGVETETDRRDREERIRQLEAEVWALRQALARQTGGVPKEEEEQ